MGLDTLQSCRDRAKLKWWYKLATLPEDRYPKQLFNQEWNIKPHSGRQRKVRSRILNGLFKSLGIDKSEWLEDIERGDSSSASFLACVEECISERESRRFEEGLNSYRTYTLHSWQLRWTYTTYTLQTKSLRQDVRMPHIRYMKNARRFTALFYNISAFRQVLSVPQPTSFYRSTFN